MLHERLLQSDSDTASFATQYHQYRAPRRILPAHHHHLDDAQHANHVKHATCSRPRFDVITPQCGQSDRPTWASMRPCGQPDITPVTTAQWSYFTGCLQPTVDWTSVPPASTFWSCTTPWLPPDDRLYTYTTVPHSSSSSTLQFDADYLSTDGVVSGCRFNVDGRRLSAETSTNTTTSGRSSSALKLNALTTTCTQRTLNSEPQHHQLSHMSTFSSRYPVCDVTSSSLDIGLIDDDDDIIHVHQFGTRPTRASTSIGTFLHIVTYTYTYSLYHHLH